jgi:hypothetical protein
MTSPTRLLALSFVVLPAAASAALAPPLNDRELMQATVVVLSFDLMAQRCRAQGGLSVEDRRRVAQWQREHRVDRVRAHLDALAQASAEDRAQLAGARTQVEQRLASIPDAQACAAALAATRQPSAQFSNSAPGLLAALESSTGKAASAAPAPKLEPGAITGGTAAAATQVQAFAFDTRMQMGAGGALWPTPVPVVLMRDGSALTDIEGLAHPGGLEAHRAAKPKAWTQWRRSGGKLQLQAREGWKNMSYNVAYEKLPSDFRLDGRYQSLSGAGTVAVGGGSSVAAWQVYEFSRDGRVSRGGGAGGRAEASGDSTTASARAPTRSGRYRIDGLTLNIQYADGSTERRLIVADPKDPKTALWLDGTGYSRRRD